jgi:chromosome segregation ATPase
LTAETEDTVKGVRKRLADTELELKAARDDLSKTKQSLARVETDLKNLSADQGKKTEPSQTESLDKTEAAAKIVQYQKELEAIVDELAGTRAAFQATKESIEAISQNHSRELEDLAKARVEEVTILQQTFDQQKEELNKAKAEADERARELEIELKDRNEPLRATLEPRSNGGTGALAISKEELVRLHEAHNMKLHSLEASHRKGIQEMQDIIDQVVKQKEELLIAGERRDMEMHFLTTENEESADRIKRYVTYHYLFIISLVISMFHGWL